METVKFALPLDRPTSTRVWEQDGDIYLITRSVTNIHNDLHNRNERWIRGGNNDLYKVHASLSHDRLSMYLYIEIDAQLKTDAFHDALYMILGTKIFGSYVSKDLRPSGIADEVAALLARRVTTFRGLADVGSRPISQPTTTKDEYHGY